MTNTTPFFSVVIPSRNRPVLLRKAVDSVTSQTFDDFEIIIVNDGSDEESEQALHELAAESAKISVVTLRRYPRGHGQSYAINSGAWASQGQYVTFLDDDDFWTDNQHLENAHQAISQSTITVSLYFTNQIAHDEATGSMTPLWLYDLGEQLKQQGQTQTHGSYTVSKKDLMDCPGFAHLNTTLVKREVFESIKGMDEDIRYECDLDFYLRIVDASTHILFNPNIIAQHRVPDKAKSTNMSTAINTYQKMNYRFYLLNKIIAASADPDIVANAKKRLTYALKHASAEASREARPALAFLYAKQALATDFSLKWLINCIYLAFRAIGR